MHRDENVFYREGLHFECQRCSACCRHEPGYAFLSESDVQSLCALLKLPEEEFFQIYCRWIPWSGNLEVLALKEKSNNDCIFWADGGCQVYTARPFQCRSFPFWHTILDCEKNWKDAAQDCPGIGKGPVITRQHIEAFLDQRLEHPYLTKDREKP